MVYDFITNVKQGSLVRISEDNTCAANQINQKVPARALLLSLAVGLMMGCSNETEQIETAAPAVSVYVVSSEEVGVYLEFVARTEAYQSADIQARVEGELIKREFKEGTLVEKDQLLFKIDPVEYQASLTKVEAEVSSSTVGAENASRNLKRGEELSRTGFISQADLDKLVTTATQANAAVQSARASVEKATLNLAFTEIRAPFAGRIGKANYDVGSIVGPQSNALATINAVDPINVSFQLDEGRYLTYLQNVQQQGEEGVAELTLRLPNDTQYAETGTINFADTSIDESMGTIGLRAEFPNPDGLVLPGLFVTLMIEGQDKKPMSLIPQVAVQKNQQGTFVLVVDAENKVVARVIKLERRINAMWAVETGLQDGERIIIEGLQKVRPGVVVSPIDKTVDKLSGTILP